MFYKSLRECCRLSWPDMRILPEDDCVWLQQVGSGLRCAGRNLQSGLQLCKIASCADLHPALHVCWDTAEAHFYHGTQLTMIVSILVWSLGGKSFNCFSVMMFCSRSFITYFRTYFTVTVDHLVVYSLGMLRTELRVSDWGSVPAPAPEKSQAVKVAE